MNGAKWFSVIDMKLGYQQIRMVPTRVVVYDRMVETIENPRDRIEIIQDYHT